LDAETGGRARKKLKKFFGSSEKISTFAVPPETEGIQKKIKRSLVLIGI
jgi:hypothetical protein